jgi:hypothetical protein
VTRRTLVLVILLALAAAVVGFLVDAKGFEVNLLAGLVGGCAGFIVAIAVVERLLERDRARRWATVSTQVRRSILGAISDIAFDFYLVNVPTLPDGATDLFRDATPSLAEKEADALARVLEYMADDIEDRLDYLSGVRQPTILIRDTEAQQRPWQVGDEKVTHWVASEKQAHEVVEFELHRASSQWLHESVRPYLRQLLESLLPRVVQVGGSPSLAAALGDVEVAERQWRWAIELVEGDWGAPEQQAWTAAAGLARALAVAARRAAE